ncbi:MAG: DUF4037 domain-containing protein [Candidatus Devosia symbiotica]|nr:DUF4037 domain-containing protein [Candidatus Devosia symbiotica]
MTQTRSAPAYFPDDIWLYKIACQWRRVADAQAFVGRAGIVGDDLGSRIIAARLAHDLIGMGFLLERCYAPPTLNNSAAASRGYPSRPSAPRCSTLRFASVIGSCVAKR